jgi:hypothetical protein
MRNLLAFLAAAVLTFLSAGWYLGWYKIQSSPSAAGHKSVTIDFNTGKIEEDLQRGEEKLNQIIDKAGKDGTPKDGKPADADPPKETKGELDKTDTVPGKKPIGKDGLNDNSKIWLEPSTRR